VCMCVCVSTPSNVRAYCAVCVFYFSSSLFDVSAACLSIDFYKKQVLELVASVDELKVGCCSGSCSCACVCDVQK
jgi:hypothetical protein